MHLVNHHLKPRKGLSYTATQVNSVRTLDTNLPHNNHSSHGILHPRRCSVAT